MSRHLLRSAFGTVALVVSACSSSSTGTDPDGGGPISGDGGSVIAAPGYFHTQGSMIVDSKGTQVRLTSLSWFGMETSNY
jgi:hypothetical protein